MHTHKQFVHSRVGDKRHHALYNGDALRSLHMVTRRAMLACANRPQPAVRSHDPRHRTQTRTMMKACDCMVASNLPPPPAPMRSANFPPLDSFPPGLSTKRACELCRRSTAARRNLCLSSAEATDPAQSEAAKIRLRRWKGKTSLSCWMYTPTGLWR